MKAIGLRLPVILAALFVLSDSISVRAASVKAQAESGALGASFSVGNDAGTQFITISPTGAGNAPSNSARVATFSVTFPEAGTYDLYLRVRVGAGAGSDDSFFYGNGFGAKSPTTVTDWILVNNIAGVGFTNATSVVTGGGTVGTGVWKWINFSEFTGSGTPITFTVPAGSLTQTFQVGGREDGLDIDALLFGTSSYSFTVAQLDAGAAGSPPQPRDLINGNLIQFNDNGTWSWYMDERAVVDAIGGKLIAGSDASASGVGGSPRNGAVEAVIFDLQGGTSQRSTLFIGAPLGPDDHNAPAFMVRPDGKYLSQWTGHNNNFLSYFSIYNGTAWEPHTTFDWTTVGASQNNEMASYSNPYYLAGENRAYTFVRTMDNRSPHILVSTDYGDSWTFYGKLVRPSTNFTVGYNPGYFRYSGNGVDRIDFICTEAHPRDYTTSMYHGYISNGMSFKTDGTVVDSNLNDTNCLFSYSFTPVFTNGTVMPPGQTNYRCWNSDVQRFPDGSIECILHARINDNVQQSYPDDEINPNHAFFFCRYDGVNWVSTYLCQAGTKMYASEGDYVGLGCLSPNDPNTIFISTRYDPRAVQPGVLDTNQPYSSVREIWKGVTTNHGASFTWTPITRDSVRDNFRPLIPAWDARHTALLWFRGTYTSAQNFDAAIVGIVESQLEATGLKTYVDATAANTTLASGAALVTGAGANQWHLQTAGGNGGSVLSSADAVGENAPLLKTTVTTPGAGTYDVWVNFWGNAGADWRLMAGLTSNGMQVFRQMACQEVEPGEHGTSLVLSSSAGYFLYQTYVGRVASPTFDVFVDDNAIQTGTTGTLIGDTARTWYDGVSFAPVASPQINLAISYDAGASSATLTWNSSSPLLSSLSAMTYTVQKKYALSDTNWTTLATGYPSGGSSTTYADTSATGSAAFYRITLP